MDETSQCPDYYRDKSTEQGLIESEESISTIRAMPGNDMQRIQPILTPRFIPSCTDEMLRGLGKLAVEHDCHVQTHCSESDWEHQYVLDRCGQTDTDALHEFGLLTDKTVLAHANFINHSDMQTIKQQHSGIAHCPLSNQYFAGSVFPLRDALNQGVQIGLGTDIAGGPSASQFDTCRQVLSSSRMLESGTNASIPANERGVDDVRTDFTEAFYLATVGGGKVLNEAIGSFQEGYHFDAMLIDTTKQNSNLHFFDELDSHEDLFQKTIYATTIENIVSVWVDGVKVIPRPARP
jgi:guanine deaminase